MKNEKILQIIPAAGWEAAYRGDQGELHHAPLVCWALVENEEGDRFITGFDTDADGYIDDAAGSTNFSGYRYLGKAAE